MNYPSDNKEHDCMISTGGKISARKCKDEQNIMMCSSLCPFFKQENYTGINYENVKLTEVGRGKIIEFANDLFLPNFYECLYCDVIDIEFSVISASKILIDVVFQIKSRVKREIDKHEVYECDKWKKDACGIMDNKCPLIGVYSLNKSPVNVVGGKNKIDDRKEKVTKLSNILFTWMPGSKCVKKSVDVSQMPEFPNQDRIIADVNVGNVIEGKNNLILGELYLNKTYSMTIECNYVRENQKAREINLVLGVFFPFPFVNFQHYENSISEELQMLDSSEYRLIVAEFKQKEKIFATPMENNDSSIGGKITQPTLLSSISEKFYYDQYAVFLQTFKMAGKGKISIASKWNDIPIISSVYNTLNALYDNEFAPVSLSMINNSDNIIGLRIEYSISEYGIEGTEQISIKAGQEMNINLKPELSEKALKSFGEITRTSCRVKVINKEGTCLWDDSNTITILPRETFVYEIKNMYHDLKVDLSSYIARWVTPHAPCIDEIIAQAGVNNKGMAGILSNNVDDMLGQIKAIYDHISKNIRYVTRSMSFDEGWYKSQRVCLPSTTMRLKSGNCIDLTVLLASCYEALRFDVEIIMLEDHAFLKVFYGDFFTEYIECTYMGKAEFWVATEKGREEYERSFNINNSPKSKGSVIVNINHSRKSNILPME